VYDALTIEGTASEETPDSTDGSRSWRVGAKDPEAQTFADIQPLQIVNASDFLSLFQVFQQ
jgi:hypothetical protein